MLLPAAACCRLLVALQFSRRPHFLFTFCSHLIFIDRFKMEDFYRVDLGSIESHVDDSAFTLLSLDLPGWFINSEIKVAFAERSAWDAVVAAAPLHVAPGLDSVLSSAEAPSILFFKSLPSPSETSKQWGVYVLVLERPGFPPLIYIGSGTNAASRIRGRFNGYLNGSGPFAELVRKALRNGYKISSMGMLCWTDLPPPHLVPRLRARFFALEAVFTIIFCACVKMIMDDVFIPDFFLWKRDDVDWQPACTHLSLSDDVRGDLKLSDEELNAAAALHRKRLAAKTQRYRKRKRDEDEEGYLQQQLDQHNAWSARNPGRVNEIAAGVRDRAKAAGRFRCETCDHNAATQYALDEHLKSASHAAAVKAGKKVVKPLSAAASARRNSRADAVANRTHYCQTCDKACTSKSDLARHNSKKKHIDAVAAAAAAAES